jgi:hypothetical protein
MSKTKMIVKGVAFNPNSQRHMRVLEWAMSQSENFSNYLRDLVMLDFEKNHMKGVNYSSKPVIEDKDADMMKKLL